jgi:hypothetical protein
MYINSIIDDLLLERAVKFYENDPKLNRIIKTKKQYLKQHKDAIEEEMTETKINIIKDISTILHESIDIVTNIMSNVAKAVVIVNDLNRTKSNSKLVNKIIQFYKLIPAYTYDMELLEERFIDEEYSKSARLS